jgi:hypothetical protein
VSQVTPEPTALPFNQSPARANVRGNSAALATQDFSHEAVTVGGPPFALPKTFWKAAGVVALSAVTYIAGSSGWVTIGPGDRISQLEGSDARQSVELQVQTRQLSDVQMRLEFVTELLCQPVIVDSAARSQGDQYLRNRCVQFTTKQPIGLNRASTGG